MLTFLSIGSMASCSKKRALVHQPHCRREARALRRGPRVCRLRVTCLPSVPSVSGTDALCRLYPTRALAFTRGECLTSRATHGFWLCLFVLVFWEPSIQFPFLCPSHFFRGSWKQCYRLLFSSVHFALYSVCSFLRGPSGGCWL